jgi:DNA gyrase subunit A
MTEDRTISTNVVDQMKEDYGAYAMAVLLGRAIPDLYDGLKPAQRRVLQTMLEENLKPDGRFVKCARVTGLTMAFYHPHGGCYGSLVNMATPWNNNVMWVNGHGNFGSTVDGPAAERYTECKLRDSAVDILLQDRTTWETRANYDGSKQEAVRFNTALPSILLNGDAGIAVGFATTLAPHGLRDIVKAVELVYKKDLKKAREVLLPDFPTGCDIIQDENLATYVETGSGSIRCRARYELGVQKRDGRAKDRCTATFTHFPPRVNPEKLGEQIKDALERGRIEGVAEINDLSDLSGDRIEVVGKPGVDGEQLAQRLFAATDLDSRYSAKTLVIDGTTPVELSPTDICQRWFTWRLARLEAKFVRERDVAEERHEIVTGLIKAISKIDEVIKTIRGAANRKEAHEKLVDRPLKFTPDQAKAILEMRLHQLTGLDASELETEREALEAQLAELAILLKNEDARAKWALKQMAELAKRHGQARRSSLVAPPAGWVKIPTSDKSGAPRVSPAAKPRFMVVDSKKGVITQAKGPRGAMVLDQKDKVIFITESGFFRKVHAAFKGPVADSYTPVIIARREREIVERKFLVVFTLDGALKATVLDGADLARVTSKGKSFLPEGAELVHFAEEAFTLDFTSKRKQAEKITLSSVKQGRPGCKGIKLANLKDVNITKS